MGNLRVKICFLPFFSCADRWHDPNREFWWLQFTVNTNIFHLQQRISTDEGLSPSGWTSQTAKVSTLLSLNNCRDWRLGFWVIGQLISEHKKSSRMLLRCFGDWDILRAILLENADREKAAVYWSNNSSLPPYWSGEATSAHTTGGPVPPQGGATYHSLSTIKILIQ